MFDDNKRVELIRKKLEQMHQGFDKNQLREIGSWAPFAESVLVDLFYAVAGMRPMVGKAALVSCGSLGRRESTPHSDLEFFLVVEGNDRLEAGYTIANGIYEKAESIHNALKVFGQDVIFGKDKENICLTTTGRYRRWDQRLAQHVPELIEYDQFIYWTNLMGGHVVMGHPELYTTLRQNLVQVSHDRKLIVDRFENDVFLSGGSVLNTWQKRDPLSTVNIKAHFLRPCTFTVTYLGAYYKVDGSGDRVHLHALNRAGYLSQPVFRIIDLTMQTAEKLRWASHLRHRDEEDKIDLDKITDFNQRMDVLTCINNVSCILELASLWIKRRRDPFFKQNSERPFHTETPERYRHAPFEQKRPK
jgi:signal-transduction protein with cAMP-binding, CBS, and nucleotidyltransferase domain